MLSFLRGVLEGHCRRKELPFYIFRSYTFVLQPECQTTPAIRLECVISAQTLYATGLLDTAEPYIPLLTCPKPHRFVSRGSPDAVALSMPWTSWHRHGAFQACAHTGAPTPTPSACRCAWSMAVAHLWPFCALKGCFPLAQKMWMSSGTGNPVNFSPFHWPASTPSLWRSEP